MIADVLNGLREHGEERNSTVEASVKERAHALTRRFPIYI